jgi:type I restriction-modification system DNA methylase subunit
MQNFSQTAAFIWSVADLLRGDVKQSQYGRVKIIREGEGLRESYLTF